MKPKLREALVVEGRYDKNAILQVVDAVVLETKGFGVFRDAEKRKLLRFYGEKRGLIVLTDSDGAGFLIRNHLKGILPKEQVKHAYIPDIYGKEKRKAAPSKEGKLGVEGMKPEVLLDALRRAGATFEDEEAASSALPPLTKADLYALGLSGRPDSAERRRALALRLGFPERMTADGLLDALNTLRRSGASEPAILDEDRAENADEENGRAGLDQRIDEPEAPVCSERELPGDRQNQNGGKQ